MTTEIAHFMRRLEQIWEEHRDALLVARDVDSAMANMVEEPSLEHLPAMTGARGRHALEQFYATDLLPHLPADLALARISRTVDRFRLVEESTISFTHDRELPWLLPGVPPTDGRAEVLVIAVVSFERGRMSSVRVLWDLATLCAQLHVDPCATVAGRGATG